MSKKVFFSITAILLLATIIYKVLSVDKKIEEGPSVNAVSSSKKEAVQSLEDSDKIKDQGISDTEVDQLNNESISEKEIQGVVKEVLRDFEEISIPKKIPSEKEKAYTLLYNNYLKTSFFLHEIAIGSIIANREDLTKAFKLILMYDKDNDTTDISDVLNIVEDRFPKVFAESLKELSSAQEERVLRIKKIEVQVDP